MNFAALKDFRQTAASSITTVIDYLSGDLAACLRELRVGLINLSLVDNFNSFQITLTIPAVTEIRVNNLIIGKIPSKWIAVRQNEAALNVCEGDTAWSLDYLYLKNLHATKEAQITVIFML